MKYKNFTRCLFGALLAIVSLLPICSYADDAMIIYSSQDCKGHKKESLILPAEDNPHPTRSFADLCSYIEIKPHNGDEGTVWVWRFVKTFPDRVIYCSKGAKSCAPSDSFSRTVQETSVFTEAIKPLNTPVVDLNSGWQESFSKSTAYTWTNSVTVEPGKWIYPYVGATFKLVHRGFFKGYYEYAGKRKLVPVESHRAGFPFFRWAYYFKWSDAAMYVWSGTVAQNRHHGYCIMNKPIPEQQYKTDAVIPAECSPPQFNP